MPEAVGDEELPMLDVVEVVALPALVGGGVRPEIDGDVEDPPAGAADELRLAALHVDARGATRAAERLWFSWTKSTSMPTASSPRCPEGLDEEAALVAMDVRLDQDDALDLGRQAAEAHWPAPSVLPYWRS